MLLNNIIWTFSFSVWCAWSLCSLTRFWFCFFRRWRWMTSCLSFFLLLFLPIFPYHLNGGFFQATLSFFLLNRCLCLIFVCGVCLTFLFLQIFCFAVCVCCIWLYYRVENSDRISLSGSINHGNLSHRRLGDVGITDSRYWSWGLKKFPRFNERNISGELDTQDFLFFVPNSAFFRVSTVFFTTIDTV